MSLLAAAESLNLTPADLIPWGPDAAKIRPEVAFESGEPTAPLILVSSISPTPAGNGKTTVTVGLTQGARRLGVRAVAALREPSLGPVFGAKGGGTGGGKSKIEPSQRINLHFTGDLHAISSAHNLLSALIDQALFFPATDPTARRPDSRRVTWKRALDMNDRALRQVIVGLGGASMGVPRQDGFDITAASEIMAILCLSKDWADLKERLGNILIGYGTDKAPVFARDLKAHGPMAALLRDALLPNLAQTTEGAPVLVHGGPFANIAHGCNSIIATRMALRRGEAVFTEGGFGFDLGGEKFLNIKCRAAGIWPSACVLVATTRALKYHGGVPAAEVAKPDAAALERGLANLERHVESVRGFGIAPVVAVNLFHGDIPGEIEWLLGALAERGIPAAKADVFGAGGAGATDIAERALDAARATRTAGTVSPRFSYDLDQSPEHKIRAVAQKVYGARDVEFSPEARGQLDRLRRHGFDKLPVCMAKTQYSLSDDPTAVGRPRDFTITVRELRVSAGAGLVVALTGELLTMPGLPRDPHALRIDLAPDGSIVGVE